MTLPLRHDASVCFDSAQVADVPFAAPGLPPGLRMRLLRQHDDGSVRSAILVLPAGWRTGPLAIVGGAQQLFVLSGAIDIAGLRLGPNCFLAGVAGQTIPAFSTEDGAELIAIFDAAPAFGQAEAGAKLVTITPDAFAIPPITPTVAGVSLAGFERRVLWEDAATGADTRLLRIPAGFKGLGANYHPVHEEIFLLDGDGGPDDTRRLKAGWYLWNPAYGIHGYNEHSVGGMVILEWHDGPWAFNLAPADTP